ncbi:23S rRNA (adenine(2503)-C(2))-methyltransferase RlmN [Arcticibacterium luteifluviistationis]|uniref:Probable dual-specificity RNA methyltransferase RlmN n=1 Tax=Arcticibacterium luteifluviistationis TaxID=1784714 RepID=A0A2Z4G871_9BACT|nr:23S rRNA (adenine(2503)-C(2))-methyltransferase RlmN [Arcticibacterium luteifluviistationis]AWV97364.1 23S rRNA (adenine(2503)-C(2))-methyltransferase RlmN [Arcticibacterium luteifluviistationis]
MGDKKIDIRGLSKIKLTDWFLAEGEKNFRANQVWEWLWQKSAISFEEMSNLSIGLRDKLNEHFVINPVRIDSSQFSSDRTIKSGFKLFDGHLVEGVLIPTPKRMTACVSSQVGCSLSCKFCATGYMKKERNLTAAEIYDQVVLIKKQAEDNYQAPLTNVVYMGMGEPLLNYAGTLGSIEKLTAPDGLNWSPKRITVSTAGIAKMIRKLGDDKVKFNLALSLHAANDEKRNQIMPINESNTLANLRDALNYFYQETGNQITLEYIVFHGFNDKLEDAQELLDFVKRVPSKVNIIEYNPIAEANYQNADTEAIDKFANFLEKRGVTVNVRRSRGKDIDAACGQLAIKEQ